MEKSALIASLLALALAAGMMIGHARGTSARRVEWGLVGFAGAITGVLFGTAITRGGFDLSTGKVSKATVVLALGALLIVLLITVSQDANARGRHGGAWAVLVLLTWPFGLALWALVAVNDRRRGRQGIRAIDDTTTQQRVRIAGLGFVTLCWLGLSLLQFQATYTAASPFTRGGTSYQIGDTVVEDCGSAIGVVAGTSPSTPSIDGVDLSNDFERSYALNNFLARDACAQQANPRIALAWSLVAFALIATAGWWLSRGRREAEGIASSTPSTTTSMSATP